MRFFISLHKYCSGDIVMLRDKSLHEGEVWKKDTSKRLNVMPARAGIGA